MLPLQARRRSGFVDEKDIYVISSMSAFLGRARRNHPPWIARPMRLSAAFQGCHLLVEQAFERRIVVVENALQDDRRMTGDLHQDTAGVALKNGFQFIGCGQLLYA